MNVHVMSSHITKNKQLSLGNKLTFQNKYCYKLCLKKRVLIKVVKISLYLLALEAIIPVTAGR